MKVGLNLFIESNWQLHQIQINSDGQEVDEVVPQSGLPENVPVDSATMMSKTAEKVMLASALILQEALRQVKALTPAPTASMTARTTTDSTTTEVQEHIQKLLTARIAPIKKEAYDKIAAYPHALENLKQKVKEIIEAKKEVVDRSDSCGLIKFLKKFFIEHGFSSWNTSRKLTNAITQINKDLQVLA